MLSRTLLLLLLTSRLLFPQNSEQEKMAWFEHDKFGMFIHWGPYSYLAGEWKGQQIPVGTEAEWIMQRFNIPVAEYREMARHLHPVNFDAHAWVELAKTTGMKYLVVTAKHHDGFAMYHSQVSRYNIVDWARFNRDPLQELAAECKKAGIRFCVYYSHREDWDDPNGYGNNWDYKRADKDFDQYLEHKSKPQLRELLSNYGPIGLVWFDRGMDTNEHAKQFVDLVHQLQPQCLINGRVGGYGQDLLGDYQDMNDNGMPAGGMQEYWETPQTLNTTWGYSKFDQQWKTPADVIHRMVEIVSKGGNYLLNIGPMADGAVPTASVATLQQVGQWMQKNSESIYGASASPLPDPSWGRITVKGDLIYLHIFTWPADGKLRVTGLLNEVRKAYPLGAASEALETRKDHGTVVVTLPEKTLSSADSVMVLETDGSPQAAPIVITQGSDSPFHLDYSAAITSGKAVKRFNREGGFHIAKWTGPNDSATWHILVSQTGAYHINIHYSARAESAGDPFQVKIGQQRIEGKVEATGDGYQYRSFPLNAIQIPKAGQYLVVIAPAKQTNHNTMYFQSLELVPDGPIMIE